MGRITETSEIRNLESPMPTEKNTAEGGGIPSAV